jgi:hypothetical protein
MLLAITAMMPATLTAQNNPPAAPQNPSPMVEHSRAHERIPQRELPGIRATFNGPLDKPVHVFIPEAAKRAKTVRLVLHFHGAAFIAEHAVAQAGNNYMAAVIQLGAGNGVYDVNFSEPAAFDSLVSTVRRTIAGELARDVAIDRIILSGFSAGHGAIRAILRDSSHFNQVDAVLLLDGFHTSYEPSGTVVAKGGTLNPVNLSEITRFAQAASAGDKRLVMTHSEIFPGTFASTTETANYVLEQLQLRRRPVLEWGPLGMQQTSEARRGRLLVIGFAGNSAPDHIDHFHGMYHFLRVLERL